jgi:hypothetical protein
MDGEPAPLADEPEDDSMAIDEEGRPRFAPSRDIVRIFLHIGVFTGRFCADKYLGSRDKSRNSKNPSSATQNDAVETSVAIHIPSPRRASQITMSNEHQT